MTKLGEISSLAKGMTRKTYKQARSLIGTVAAWSSLLEKKSYIHEPVTLTNVVLRTWTTRLAKIVTALSQRKKHDKNIAELHCKMLEH